MSPDSSHTSGMSSSFPPSPSLTITGDAAPWAGVPGIENVLGSTPLVRLPRWERHLGSRSVRLWAKLESYNPSGSAKDRTATAMVLAALRNGQLFPGAMVVESSSGNLGIALARLAVITGFDFHCVVDPRTNGPTVAMMEAYGATIHMVDKPDSATGDWLAARKQKVRELLDTHPQAINFDQYSNHAAFRAHAAGTMSEILDAFDTAPERVYVAVSTTGTFGGCAQEAQRREVSTTVIPVDSEGSVLFGGTRGTRVLPGYGAGVVPQLAEGLDGSEIRRVSPLDAVHHARMLARTEAILPGASGGAVLAAIAADLPDLYALRRPLDVVAIMHDDGAGYLSTIYDDDWVSSHLGSLP